MLPTSLPPSFSHGDRCTCHVHYCLLCLCSLPPSLPLSLMGTAAPVMSTTVCSVCAPYLPPSLFLSWGPLHLSCPLQSALSVLPPYPFLSWGPLHLSCPLQSALSVLPPSLPTSFSHGGRCTCHVHCSLLCLCSLPPYLFLSCGPLHLSCPLLSALSVLPTSLPLSLMGTAAPVMSTTVCSVCAPYLPTSFSHVDRCTCHVHYCLLCLCSLPPSLPLSLMGTAAPVMSTTVCSVCAPTSLPLSLMWTAAPVMSTTVCSVCAPYLPPYLFLSWGPLHLSCPLQSALSVLPTSLPLSLMWTAAPVMSTTVCSVCARYLPPSLFLSWGPLHLSCPLLSVFPPSLPTSFSHGDRCTCHVHYCLLCLCSLPPSLPLSLMGTAAPVMSTAVCSVCVPYLPTSLFLSWGPLHLSCPLQSALSVLPPYLFLSWGPLHLSCPLQSALSVLPTYLIYDLPPYLFLS